MTMPPELRVFTEELEPANTLRLTWRWEDGEREVDDAGGRRRVVEALSNLEGVSSAEPVEEGVVVAVAPAQVSRASLAATVQAALNVPPPVADDKLDPGAVRVWSEDLSERRLRLTWQRLAPLAEGDAGAERRRVAAWLAGWPEIREVRIDDAGLIIDYEPGQLERHRLGELVRETLRDEADLKTRANELVKRAPIYGNLAQRLARDGRISPLPEAARQTAASRGSAGEGLARRAATRGIPGARLIGHIQTMLPLIQALSAWSREAPPEIVDEHLAAVGLDRAILDADAATAQEARLFARDYAGEKAAEVTDKAAAGARKAIDFGRDWFESRRAAMDPDSEPEPPPEPDPANNQDDDTQPKPERDDENQPTS